MALPASFVIDFEGWYNDLFIATMVAESGSEEEEFYFEWVQDIKSFLPQGMEG